MLVRVRPGVVMGVGLGRRRCCCCRPVLPLAVGGVVVEVGVDKVVLVATGGPDCGGVGSGSRLDVGGKRGDVACCVGDCLCFPGDGVKKSRLLRGLDGVVSSSPP